MSRRSHFLKALFRKSAFVVFVFYTNCTYICSYWTLLSELYWCINPPKEFSIYQKIIQFRPHSLDFQYNISTITKWSVLCCCGFAFIFKIWSLRYSHPHSRKPFDIIILQCFGFYSNYTVFVRWRYLIKQLFSKTNSNKQQKQNFSGTLNIVGWVIFHICVCTANNSGKLRKCASNMETVYLLLKQNNI